MDGSFLIINPLLGIIFFRDMKISHEEVVNRIMDDLVNAGSPYWIHLNAAFNPRGNVSMQLDIFSGQKKN